MHMLPLLLDEDVGAESSNAYMGVFMQQDMIALVDAFAANATSSSLCDIFDNIENVTSSCEWAFENVVVS